MKRIKNIYIWIYSLYFCLRVFSLRQALKLPVKISPNIKLGYLYKGCIVINSLYIKRGMITIGLVGSEAVQYLKGYLTIKGQLIFNCKADFGKGTSIRVDENAQLIIGDNFWCNKNTFIRCNQKIVIGDHVLMGWNCTINDCDGHTLIDSGISKSNCGSVGIGNHVWIASNVTLLKNTFIADECVVASHSLCCKSYTTAHSLIAGMPARIIKNNISWKL